MCLYPRLMLNSKYKENQKNGGNIPAIPDNRVLMVPTACGNCMECRKQKAREWQIRLQEEIKTSKNGKFITLTFNTESLKAITEKTRQKNNGEIWKLTHLGDGSKKTLRKIQKIKEKTYGYGLDNEIATYGMRHFLERWRKEYEQSVRHWGITELGHQGTEHVHIHAIIWTDKTRDDIERKWQYGYIYPRNEREAKKNYVNAQTVNYIIKYVHKVDEKHKHFKSKILNSDGIGANYVNTHNSKNNKYKGVDTIETYKTTTGHNIAMPIYYRNKIYTDEEKEKLWLQRLDRQERWVNGVKIDVSKGEEEYYKMLKEEQKRNKQLGYGSDEKEWRQREYEISRRIIIQKERIKQP